MPTREEFSTLDALPPQWTLFHLITSHYVSRAIYVAAKLGIADLMRDGSRHYKDLARASDTDASTLNRLLLLLSSAGVFVETDPGCFALAPAGEYLRSDVHGSRRAQALLLAGPAQQRSWSGLLDIIKTGEVPSGRSTFEFVAKYPEEGAIFNDAMTAGSAEAASAVTSVYDFGSFGTIVDVGGGHGVLLSGILKAIPASRGIIFDLPHAAEGANQRIDVAGLRGRCEFVAGDFFEEVPASADAYLLKSVIHDWDDTRSVAILRNIHKAMAPHGKLLLIEMMYPARMDQTHMNQIVARSDLNMLVNLGGCERTESEFGAILSASGFELTSIVSTRTPWSVIEGVRRS